MVCATHTDDCANLCCSRHQVCAGFPHIGGPPRRLAQWQQHAGHNSRETLHRTRRCPRLGSWRRLQKQQRSVAAAGAAGGGAAGGGGGASGASDRKRGGAEAARQRRPPNGPPPTASRGPARSCPFIGRSRSCGNQRLAEACCDLGRRSMLVATLRPPKSHRSPSFGSPIRKASPGAAPEDRRGSSFSEATCIIWKTLSPSLPSR